MLGFLTGFIAGVFFGIFNCCLLMAGRDDEDE